MIQSQELRRRILEALAQLKDFIPHIKRKSEAEIDAKQDKILEILDFDTRSKLVSNDRAKVQHVFFEIDYKTRAQISIYFPKVDQILTDKIFH